MNGKINRIPEVITDFNIYEDGTKLIGVSGTVTLPKLEAITETISGAGLAGEYETTVPGHFASLKIDVPFEVMHTDPAKLYAKKTISLTLRGDQQMRDIAAGTLTHERMRVVVTGIPMGLDPGQLAKGKKSSASVTVEILRYEMYLADEEIIVLDKPNYVFRMFGEDMLAEIRNNI